MRYWIFDRDDSPQGFPLQQLMDYARTILALADNCECDVVKVWGYGESVVALQERLGSEPAIRVLWSEIYQLALGTEEWFYDIRIKVVGFDLVFGIHDSTALFVEGSTESTLLSISRHFENARREVE
jgi:hypothetical protein